MGCFDRFHAGQPSARLSFRVPLFRHAVALPLPAAFRQSAAVPATPCFPLVLSLALPPPSSRSAAALPARAERLSAASLPAAHILLRSQRAALASQPLLYHLPPEPFQKSIFYHLPPEPFQKSIFYHLPPEPFQKSIFLHHVTVVNV
eukprot:GHVT01008698.1.p2 GENE.GHVT01008698.1~~GHVT01008698.1.p2  ORF type:complete len:147 (+),score=18.62 GHVT01008698.1:2011-2451(+)